MAGRGNTAKRIAPGVYDALVDALATLFWNKRPFERYLRLTFRDHPELLAGLTFAGLKREVAADLVMRLAEGEDHYQALTLAFMVDVAAMDDFTNLRAQSDGEHLVGLAIAAQAALRKWTARYGALSDAHEQLRAEQAAMSEREDARRSVARVLDELRDAFLAMHGATDRQQRGRDFQGLLNDLFHLFDLNPRKSFCLANEEIDGAFTFSTDDYLLEAKWEKTVASRSDVDVLAQKVQRKAKNTMGLFIAISGFSRPAIDAHTDTGGGLIFMEGTDLFAILDGQMALDDLLERKRRHLSETGQPLRLVRDMLSH